MLVSIGTWSFANWLPLYFTETFHMSLAGAGFSGTFAIQTYLRDFISSRSFLWISLSVFLYQLFATMAAAAAGNRARRVRHRFAGGVPRACRLRLLPHSRLKPDIQPAKQPGEHSSRTLTPEFDNGIPHACSLVRNV